jgi:hypothetical protein
LTAAIILVKAVNANVLMSLTENDNFASWENKLLMLQSIISCDVHELGSHLFTLLKNLLNVQEVGINLRNKGWVVNGKEVNLANVGDYSEGLSEEAFTTQDAVCALKETSHDENFIFTQEPRLEFVHKSIICCPLIIGKNCYGIVCVKNKMCEYKANKYFPFNTHDVVVLKSACTNAAFVFSRAAEFNKALRDIRLSEAVLTIVRARAAGMRTV